MIWQGHKISFSTETLYKNIRPLKAPFKLGELTALLNFLQCLMY